MSPKADPDRPSSQTRSASAKSNAAASSSSQPYPPHSSGSRRSSSQPKSTRQQFSACGACRMRRVRCDLKDLQAANPAANHSACSNCQERGLKCVDEFAEVKAVKLLRRGRRLAQVEAVYGKTAIQAQALGTATSIHTTIPRLRPEFFASPFYHAFLLQRPIIDPLEFASRFNDCYSKGDINALGTVGNLLCLVLATWAASYGINELGEPEPHGGHQALRRRKERTNEMVRELLHLVDHYSLLRKPTWDGVRTLLLIVPLSEDVQTPMERLVLYESTINQVYTLCSLANTSTVASGQGEFVDAAIRARIFWYAHIHEGLTTGLRGGRLILSDMDLAVFEDTLPVIGNMGSIPRAAASYSVAYRYSRTPAKLSRICRTVHALLTGMNARQMQEIDENSLRGAWDALAQSWDELDALRRVGTAGILQQEDVERFVHGWQILIFECYNVIREALKQRIVSSSPDNTPTILPDGRVTRQSSRLGQAMKLHAIADSKCRDVARLVVSLIQRHIGSGSMLFELDASLVRDGVFYAGVLLAGETGTEEEVKTCLHALREMRWAFSKSEEREQTIKMVWETRSMGGVSSASVSPYQSQQSHSGTNSGSNTPPQHRMRQQPPPLSIVAHTGALGELPDSGPNTAATEDGHWGPISGTGSSRRTPPSLSNSPPFLQPGPGLHMGSSGAKVGAMGSSLMLASTAAGGGGESSVSAAGHHPGAGVYFGGDADHFAFSVPGGVAVAAPGGQQQQQELVHDLTPPRSSAGMSTVSYHSDGFYDAAAVFQSPPGSAAGPSDPSVTGLAEQAMSYQQGYGAGAFYVTQ
ncbi:hypothetical protein SCHPADRAFT_910706 [Schizopora paradoxa]|uniref:Zn(2)-C6 fungal-type domain-containing protein n=1 Tax=Schizopora paradoxa TaxID=27342 RepID=A0A0H2R901_9AGAM|nr:hypothetical protein SCHPADRAFT_910706 [Schizopora paradoxa]